LAIACERRRISGCRFSPPKGYLGEGTSVRNQSKWKYFQLSWFFSLQVLPARTHPEIAMNSTGGYLLSGITVNPDNPQDTGLPSQAKKPKLDEYG